MLMSNHHGMFKDVEKVADASATAAPHLQWCAVIRNEEI